MEHEMVEPEWRDRVVEIIEEIKTAKDSDVVLTLDSQVFMRVVMAAVALSARLATGARLTDEESKASLGGSVIRRLQDEGKLEEEKDGIGMLISDAAWTQVTGGRAGCLWHWHEVTGRHDRKYDENGRLKSD